MTAANRRTRHRRSGKSHNHDRRMPDVTRTCTHCPEAFTGPADIAAADLAQHLIDHHWPLET